MSRVVPSQVVDLLKSMFPDIENPDRFSSYANLNLNAGTAVMLNGIAELIRQIPPELLSVLPAEDFSHFVANLSAIEIGLGRWKGGDNYHTLHPVGKFKGESLSPIVVIHMLLSKCPDAFPRSDVPGLAFVDDQKLKEDLRLDLSAIENALAHSQWKAATILAGATIEALLLWRLAKEDASLIGKKVQALKDSKPDNFRHISTNIENWNLSQYIEVAATIPIIRSETAVEARLAKDYRNLIHPGRGLRLNQQCSRATTFTAVASVLHVLEDLSRQTQ